MISSFRDKETQKIFDRIPSRRFAMIQGRAEEKLAGDRKGQYSIRINGQFRICFTWRDGNAHEVEIVDYH